MALKYYLNEAHQFVIEDYQKGTPFASFLPGVAGIDGIPMWVYYVNRGQGISGFGVENKDQPLLEFSPANVAYKRTELEGFRTFLKVDGKVVEVFSSLKKHPRKMIIDFNGVGFEETLTSLKLRVRVQYVTLSHTAYPGLLRKVEVINLDTQPRAIEIVDGLGTLWPYGTDQFFIKNMSNLAVAWFDVFNVDNYVPFYQNRTSNSDSALMEKIERGHFTVTYNALGQKCPIIVDSELVFDQDTALLKPTLFEQHDLKTLLEQPQMTNNRLTAGLSAHQVSLNDTYVFYSLYGRVPSLNELTSLESHWSPTFFENQFKEAAAIASMLKKPVETQSGNPLYDAYIGQCLIDNTLRGGYPLLFKNKKGGHHIYHVFSRIHGDMEREYNYFSVEPNFYSQGNGSYRDVNQNRRNDVYLEPEAGLFSIQQFYELIQLDGHNPLSIKGSIFHFPQEELETFLKTYPQLRPSLPSFLSKPFTPGQLYAHLIKITDSIAPIFETILSLSQQEHQAVYGTGYWSDHWTYNLDLVDNYLAIFPDQKKTLMLERPLRFYQSHMSVLPRALKWVQLPDGRVRQLEPVYDDHEKMKRIGLKKDTMHYVASEQGHVITTSLLGKMLHLAAIKLLALDPFGMGIMMDAEKPGWNDAMNGLPGIFGSGLSETIELKRALHFLLTTLNELPITSTPLPVFLTTLMTEIDQGIQVPCVDEKTLVARFEKLQTIRETFEEKTRFYASEQTIEVALSLLKKQLQHALDVVNDGIERATSLADGLVPTYLTYEAVSFTLNGLHHPHLKHPCVTVHTWKVRALPHFLEAPARLLKTLEGSSAQKMADRVAASELYDPKLDLFVTSTPLDQETMDIGRIRVFTAGWLERESTFMHMSYKYLIGLLKSGRYSAYFKALKTHLPIYRDPKQYGRSPLENSSFIATSRNPNTRVHGKGYVARLTGTTAEMLTMHHLMSFGKHPFEVQEEGVVFQPHPILPKNFFDQEGRYETTLFSTTKIIYLNPQKQSTYQMKEPLIKQIMVKENGKTTVLDKPYLPHAWTLKLRQKQLQEVTFVLS